MKQHWDIAFGVVGGGGTLALSQINQWLAFATGVLTVCVLAVRLMREIKNWNKPPKG